MSVAAVRSRLAGLSSRISVGSLPPTPDVLRGAERLLLGPGRASLRGDYASLLSAGGHDAVATSVNTSVSFLDAGGLFEDMSRDNDISYYVVGRGKKGVTDAGEEYSFAKQGGGYRHCIPRGLVSEGEKVRFAGLLVRLAAAELVGAAREAGGGAAALTGASVYLEAAQAGPTTREECLENQLRAAAEEAPDCVFVTGADTDEKIELLREVVRRNEKRMVRLSVPDTTGTYFKDEEDTEIGFDVPTVVLRDGEIHEIL